VNYLNELNEEQRVAVEHTEGPVMVLAGAGSGKTRVLTYRIAHLIKLGVPPFNILALTFTNKAAREMKIRIAKIVGESEARNIWMGTFHSVFAKILRLEADKIGYPKNFTIYDTDDSRRLLKEIIKERNLDDKVYKPSLVHSRISKAKNNLLSPTAYQRDVSLAKEDIQSKKPELGKIYEIYDLRLFRAGAMDFDDLLFKTNVLLRDFPDILLKYQNKFRYILVDEYQDTNFAQYLIVRSLAARFENICVVGDDAQSIYSFRGANIQNILNFKNDYRDTATYKLEQNYRSTNNIVQAANSIISKNVEQFKKDVWTANQDGNKIKVLQTHTDSEEAQSVTQSIFEIVHTERSPYSNFAILYRTNAQSRAMEDALRRRNIPYRIYGGLSFYQRKEIKDLLAYFRLIANLKDEDAIKRTINYPARGIGNTSQEKLFLYANENDLGLWEVISNLDSIPIQIHGGAKNSIKQYVELIKSFKVIAEKKDAYEAGHQIASATGILKELNTDKTIEGISRYENVQELLNAMRDFVENAEENNRIADFIQDIPLLTDQDAKTDEDKDTVTLMTIHASKGLEFPYVFIVGLEEDLFPSMMSSQSRSDLEEERRLFYVAVTRAEKHCYLSYSLSRYKWGNITYSEPSRFIKEINPQFLDLVSSNSTAKLSNPIPSTSWESSIQGKTRFTNANSIPTKQTVTPAQINIPSDAKPINSNSSVKEGFTVYHDRFGRGIVKKIEGSGENSKATIDFENLGSKQLLLRFAKLRML
jgi:DNA helicase-2/ATP-dependent DNA helicase PcrA